MNDGITTPTALLNDAGAQVTPTAGMKIRRAKQSGHFGFLSHDNEPLLFTIPDTSGRQLSYHPGPYMSGHAVANLIATSLGSFVARQAPEQSNELFQVWKLAPA